MSLFFVQRLEPQRFVEAACNFYIGLGDQFDTDRKGYIKRKD
jgi:hypothetical protein